MKLKGRERNPNWREGWFFLDSRSNKFHGGCPLPISISTRLFLIRHFHNQGALHSKLSVSYPSFFFYFQLLRESPHLTPQESTSGRGKGNGLSIRPHFPPSLYTIHFSYTCGAHPKGHVSVLKTAIRVLFLIFSSSISSSKQQHTTITLPTLGLLFCIQEARSSALYSSFQRFGQNTSI